MVMKGPMLLAVALALPSGSEGFLVQPTMTMSMKQAKHQPMDRRSAIASVVSGGAAVLAGVAAVSAPQVASAYGNVDDMKKPKKKKVEAPPPKKAADGEREIFTTKGGVKFIVLEEGSGVTAQSGDYCVVEYTGYLNNGQVFDASNAPGRKPVAFKLGSAQVIPAWEEVVLNMKPGGEVQMVVPPEMGYGKKGVCLEDGECLVPPGETLKYDLKLKRAAVPP